MKRKKKIILGLIIVIILGLICGIVYLVVNYNNSEDKKIEVETKTKKSSYTMKDNDLGMFDLYFLQLESNHQNLIYSPLSIKYTLAMLKEGAKGETKNQITNIIGNYKSHKYINSSNMSLANAMFIKDTEKEYINDNYIKTLKEKYDAEVIYDTFESANDLNSWVSDKTFKLIDNLFDDLNNLDYVLVNALAIDMEWVNKIQTEYGDWRVHYDHEDYDAYVMGLSNTDYHALDFKGFDKKVKSVEIGASANRYDIVNALGENTIREDIKKRYTEWLASNPGDSCNGVENEPDADTFVEQYIKELKTGYNQYSSSTDFYFYDDSNVKVFAKDLKEYNGTTLQYVGIMPKSSTLTSFMRENSADDIKKIINNIKPIELNSFKDGVITKIKGYIPMFKFDYKLSLADDLKKMGITNIFDSKKVDLTNLTKGSSVIVETVHKANIDFSNDGIKAAAATALGGAGAGGCGFDYLYQVPVEEIDLTFDNPYVFIIRDKSTGEVWFVGSVYEPYDITTDAEYCINNNCNFDN